MNDGCVCGSPIMKTDAGGGLDLAKRSKSPQPPVLSHHPGTVMTMMEIVITQLGQALD